MELAIIIALEWLQRAEEKSHNASHVSILYICISVSPPLEISQGPNYVNFFE